MDSEKRTQKNDRQYRVKIGIGGLDFKDVSIEDPLPTGRQLLASVWVNPKEDWSLFAILPSGDFEDVRLDETFDLREPGAEAFIAFQTDRDFKFTIRGSQMEWGKPTISGRELGKLANLKDDEAVFLEVQGGEDRLVEGKDLIPLSKPVIERFIVAQKPKPGFEIVVNGRLRVVDEENISYAHITEIAFPGQGGPMICFAVTYRKAASTPHAGELGEGQSVKVKKQGTIFNVTLTDKS